MQRKKPISSLRLGIDVGGTFTDLVLLDEASGVLHALKVPSTPRRPAQSIADGIRRLAQRHSLSAADIGYFSHGQTFALNTVLQRQGARTGLLVTAGFRDILAIGRLRLPDPVNFFVQQTAALVDPGDIREVAERVRADGTVERAVDPAQVESLAGELAADGVTALVICFLHSYAFPEHERQAAERVRNRFPDLYVSASHEIWPEQREYERCLASALNSYVGPSIDSYFADVTRSLGDLGVPAAVQVTKSNGGIMNASRARRAPVETLLSGPASGVTGAMAVAEAMGSRRFMTVDMGGTSVDVAIVDGGVPYSTDSKLGEFPLIIPAVEISSIGAGGGSVAWVDPSGVLKVGPRSAGADPGPACYGRGGTEPTLTDAYVVAGLISPEAFAGGDVRLDADAALASLRELGRAIGLGPREAASAVIDVTTEKMYAQLIPVLARRGVDPADLTMLAFGGAGPTHACLLAQETGVRQVVVPWSPGTLCAYGALITGYRHDLVRTVGRKTSDLDDTAIAAAYADLDRQARQWLEEQGVPAAGALLHRQADVQFLGQSFTLLVTLSPGDVATAEELRARFLDDYAAAYGIRDHTAEIEIVNLRVSIATVPERPPVRPGAWRDSASADGRAAAVTRAVMERGTEREALVVSRDSLGPGSALTGPAIVSAADTTIYLPAGCSASVDEAYNLVVTIGGVDA